MHVCAAKTPKEVGKSLPTAAVYFVLRIEEMRNAFWKWLSLTVGLASAACGKVASESPGAGVDGGLASSDAPAASDAAPPCAACPPPCVNGVCAVKCDAGQVVCAGGIGCCRPSLLGAGNSTCVVRNGGVKCWGSNFAGQLGDGTTTPRTSPVDVVGLQAGVVSIAVGIGSACALMGSGGVRCWGDNASGQLGDGTQISRHTPVEVVGLGAPATSISVGWGHACAVTVVGGAKCWGNNASGALGDGTTTTRSTPVEVFPPGSAVTEISASSARSSRGDTFSCAVKKSGAVSCWGKQDVTPEGYALTPHDVDGLDPATMVGAGVDGACEVTTAGAVTCWGQGPRNIGAAEPHPIALRTKAVAVASNDRFACVLLVDGSLTCWGDNALGELGDGTMTSDDPTCRKCRVLPVTGVLGIGGSHPRAVAMAIGQVYGCALLENGGVKCWGLNDGGQLGDGTTTARAAPVDVKF